MLTTMLSLATLLLMQQPAGPSPSLKARLHAAHEAVAPGGSTELAIEIEVTKRWHIYHPILLDTGFATEIKFELPEGTHVRDLRWPTPELSKTGDMEYLGWEGRIIALATLDVDKSVASGTTLDIRANVTALACIEACIPVEGDASLKLSVAEKAGPGANTKLFEEAREALPKPLSEAPYIKGSRLAVSQTQIPVGGKGEIAALIVVEKDHTIQHREPGVDTLIPSRLFIESVDGVKLGEAVWPDVKATELPGVGKLRKLEGPVLVRLPLEINDANFEPRAVRQRVLLQYQACTKQGTCYPPEMAEAFITYEVVPAGSPAVASRDELFAVAAAGGTSGFPTADSGKATDGQAGKREDGASAASPAQSNETGPLWFIFLTAFIGGAILNVMPCVLPVISLKIFSFMQQAGDSHARVLAMGLVYGVGVLASFAVLGAVMVTVGLAWGGFMQEPLYVLILCAVVFAFGLSLLGVWELHLPGMVENVAGSVTTREGYGGAFLNGLMATALATPCVAPFLGTAMGALVQMPAPIAFAGIMMAGLGMATPYVLLTAFPGWLKIMPKPGHWMVTFKQFMGFVLMGTCVWLLWVLQYLVSPIIVVSTVMFFLFVALACWMIGKLTLSASMARVWATYGGSIAVMAVGWYASFEWLAGGVGFDAAPQNTVVEAEWLQWRPGIEEDLSKQGYTVYVDFTAKWCATCQTNKATVLKQDPVKSKLKEMNVVMVEADFTRRNPQIMQALRARKRAGVPLNIIVPAGRAADEIVLPELLTSGIVLEALQKAGPSTNRSPALAAADQER